MKRTAEGAARSPGDEPVALGLITKPHGLAGACRASPYGGEDTLLLSAKRLWVREDVGWRALTVRGASPQGPFVILQFKEIASVEDAEALRGREVGLPRGKFPKPKPGEHYWRDLIGLAVYEEGASDPRGEVTGLMPSPGADNLEIRDADGFEWMLPFTEDNVPEVDVAGGRIVVRIPEGLLD